MFINLFSVRVLGHSEKGDGKTGYYIPIKHKTQYTLRLKNNRSVDASASLTIDGKPMGIYHVPAKSHLDVNSPMEEGGRFTFVKQGTDAGKAVTAQLENKNLGLISIEFVPFKAEVKKEKIMEIFDIYRRHWPDIHIYPWPWYTYPYWRYDPQPLTITYTSDIKTGPLYNQIYTMNPSKLGTSATVNSVSPNEKISVNCISQASPGATGLQGESDNEYFTPPEDAVFDEKEKTTIMMRLVAVEKLDEDEIRPPNGYATAYPAALS